ncbi:hypothetical protein DMC30DRAFT_392426 [Rhodotorula diobovata]|uniref:Uncharacterized protein n=1 Tax=Rhodotorula diobovata TaxID=5288 RepID=A0A5C5G1D4_9BASI|nr:hypothetical protein DMC30DRAFT_392426 [Rhodotorula diobovata]
MLGICSRPPPEGGDPARALCPPSASVSGHSGASSSDTGWATPGGERAASRPARNSSKSKSERGGCCWSAKALVVRLGDLARLPSRCIEWDPEEDAGAEFSRSGEEDGGAGGNSRSPSVDGRGRAVRLLARREREEGPPARRAGVGLTAPGRSAVSAAPLRSLAEDRHWLLSAQAARLASPVKLLLTGRKSSCHTGSLCRLPLLMRISRRRSRFSKTRRRPAVSVLCS